MDEEQVKKQVQELVDRFYDAIKDVPDEFDIGVQRQNSLRETEPQCDPSFKEKLLARAPRRDMDFVLAEKKTW